MPSRVPLIERLGDKFVFAADGCWIWTAALSTSGYGKIYDAKGKPNYAHRVMYELLREPIADSMHIDHLCCNKTCVNPAHLEVVTRAENTRRANAKRTHCKRGHEFTPENTHTRDGLRICKPCWRIRKREEETRKRAVRDGLAA